MTRLHPRPTAAVGTLLCALGATYVMSGLSVHGDASSSPEGRRESNASTSREEFQEPNVRTVTVVASKYHFSPSTIEVAQNDVVKVELRTEDIAHSLTIDAYR